MTVPGSIGAVLRVRLAELVNLRLVGMAGSAHVARHPG